MSTRCVGRTMCARETRLRRAADGDTGSVAAEFAVVLPAVMIVLALCAGALTAATHQVRLQDAAADAARLAARGEPASRVVSTVSAAVAGAGAAVRPHDELVCVDASAHLTIGGIVSIPIRATSCALAGGL